MLLKNSFITCLILYSKVYCLDILKGGNKMSKYESLNSKVVVIAGGAKNLGALLSKSYAKEGAKLLYIIIMIIVSNKLRQH